ncbi:MAG: prefoldin subunit alpha [Nanoarchaeota archaeon]|nr:prefoldin subunit alpha [Nanoarchaeota archaeon]
MDIQELGHKMKFIEQQMMQLEYQFNELNLVKDSIIEVMGTDEGKEILLPLGAGVFMKAIVKDSNSLLMNVGSEVVVEKSFAESLELVESQIKQLEDIKNHMETEFETIQMQMQMMQMKSMHNNSEESN